MFWLDDWLLPALACPLLLVPLFWDRFEVPAIFFPNLDLLVKFLI